MDTPANSVLSEKRKYLSNATLPFILNGLKCVGTQNNMMTYICQLRLPKNTTAWMA